jgi:hypothetical protein
MVARVRTMGEGLTVDLEIGQGIIGNVFSAIDPRFMDKNEKPKLDSVG